MNDEPCQHVWNFYRKDYVSMYRKCSLCGEERKIEVINEMVHPYIANQVASELNIRHDDKDGDV